MDFEKSLKETAEKLDREIGGILGDFLKEVRQVSPKLVSLCQAFIKTCEGGKRIRGTLVKLGYEMTQSVIPDSIGDPHYIDSRFRGNDIIGNDIIGNDIIRVAAAYEILHSSILAHDDIIDKSPQRRGQPSLYKSVGIAQAITLADLGFFLAIKIISESKFADKLKIQAVRLFSQTMVDTAMGQILDIARGDPKTVALLKTARYTISGPLKLGAILGGAKAELIRELGLFGENLGIAFQMRDDILDEEVTSVERTKVEMLKYADRARIIIPRLTGDKKMKRLLNEMVDYMVERSS